MVGIGDDGAVGRLLDDGGETFSLARESFALSDVRERDDDARKLIPQRVTERLGIHAASEWRQRRAARP